MVSKAGESFLALLADLPQSVVRNHGRIVDEVASQQRLVVCKSCPSFEENKCKECGCYMPFKATLLAASCPLGKWPSQ